MNIEIFFVVCDFIWVSFQLVPHVTKDLFHLSKRQNSGSVLVVVVVAAAAFLATNGCDFVFLYTAKRPPKKILSEF